MASKIELSDLPQDSISIIKSHLPRHMDISNLQKTSKYIKSSVTNHLPPEYFDGCHPDFVKAYRDALNSIKIVSVSEIKSKYGTDYDKYIELTKLRRLKVYTQKLMDAYDKRFNATFRDTDMNLFLDKMIRVYLTLLKISKSKTQTANYIYELKYIYEIKGNYSSKLSKDRYIMFELSNIYIHMHIRNNEKNYPKETYKKLDNCIDYACTYISNLQFNRRSKCNKCNLNNMILCLYYIAYHNSITYRDTESKNFSNITYAMLVEHFNRNVKTRSIINKIPEYNHLGTMHYENVKNSVKFISEPKNNIHKHCEIIIPKNLSFI